MTTAECLCNSASLFLTSKSCDGASKKSISTPPGHGTADHAHAKRAYGLSVSTWAIKPANQNASSEFL